MSEAKVTKYSFSIDSSDAGKRIDAYLGSKIEELSRSQIQKLFSKQESSSKLSYLRGEKNIS